MHRRESDHCRAHGYDKERESEQKEDDAEEKIASPIQPTLLAYHDSNHRDLNPLLIGLAFDASHQQRRAAL